MKVLKTVLPVIGILLAVVGIVACSDPQFVVKASVKNETDQPVHIFAEAKGFSPDNKIMPGEYARIVFVDEQEPDEQTAEVVVKIVAGQNGVIGGRFEAIYQHSWNRTDLFDQWTQWPDEVKRIDLCVNGLAGNYQFEEDCGFGGGFW